MHFLMRVKGCGSLRLVLEGDVGHAFPRYQEMIFSLELL